MLDNSLFIYPSVEYSAPLIGRIDTSDYGTVINCLWNIEYTNGVCYISHTRNNTTYYIRSQSTTNNARIVLTTNKNDSGTRWKFSQYTGPVIEDIEMDVLDTSIYCGESFQYHAYMLSSRIDHLGPINYSVQNVTSATTNLAVIDSLTGYLTALGIGTIKIRVSYLGSPWVWVWTVNINPAGCKEYYHINSGSTSSFTINCQGYALWTHTIDNSWCEDLFSLAYTGEFETSNEFLYGRNEVWGMKDAFEYNYLNNVFTGRWEEAHTSNNGWDIELDDNQWLIVFRVGLHAYGADYHFWYRTNMGKWTNKHGYQNGSGSELLDDLPSDDDSSGWAAGDRNRFYDSDIIYYIITEE